MRRLCNPVVLFACTVATGLFVLGPVPAAGQGIDIEVRLSPGLTIPVGLDRDLFSLGGEALLEGGLVLAAAPWLRGSVGIGYGISGVDVVGSPSSVSLLSAGGALAFRLPIGDRFVLEAGGGGGYHHGLINGSATRHDGGGVVYGSGGVGFAISPTLTLGITGSYRNYLGLGQFVTVSIGTTLRIRPGAGLRTMGPSTVPPRPLAEAAEAEFLRIDDVTVQEVFPVFFKYYDKHPVGSARITNVSDEAISDIHLTLMVRQYMDNATACQAPPDLEPGESATVEISGFFNDSVVNITESTKVSAEFSLEFAQDNKEYLRTYTQTLRLHDRNSMTWDDLRKPAAYVTTKDTAVMTFSRQIAGVVGQAEQSAVHPTLRTAIALHTALALYGMNYTPDPSSPYRRRETELAIDYLQFPRQTLHYKAGDCDDLTILYCALLESLGIPTAMILVPGHIFAALDLQMTADEARSQFARAEDLIFLDDSTWIPLEVTSISDGFLTAWQTGAREWREAVAREQETLIVTADAWESYEPVWLPEADQPITMPPTESIQAAYSEQGTQFVDQTIYPLVAQLRAQIDEQGRRPSLVNRLSVLYARYGLYDRARRELAQLLDEAPDYAPAMANLGNIAFREGDAQTAVNLFQEALELRPDNPAILLSLARASHQIENYGTANWAFARVKELDPSLADRFAYLDLRGDDATRAAQIGGLDEVILWIDQEDEE